MRLKRLTLNGYKTFATKTVFEFGEGITCIVGPNGSGKSNIADGIRWALGEQQFSLLRSKKTDDMIFAGSAKRPRASMAEVVLTFDNSDGFFPIAFNEIEIGRRAYRDGSNEYLLNGNRVRLRDVSDLLAHSGLAERNYTVIGQGMVDEALAQKPEERRALFEEAAGITAYRDRREDALRKLEETRHNLERMRDILNEISPRLKQLERQAERARQYRALADALGQLIRQWLGYQYSRVKRAIQATLLAQQAAQQAVAELTDQINALEQQLLILRESLQALQAQRAEHLLKRDALRQLAEAAARDLAVMRARVAGLEEQVATAQSELEALDATIQVLAARAAEAEHALAEARAAYQACQYELQTAEQLSAAHQQEREALEAQRIQAQQRVREAAERTQSTRNHIAALRAKQEALRGQIATLSQRATELGTQREQELATLKTLITAVEREAVQVNLLDAQHEAAQQALDSARLALEQAQAALAAAEAEERLSARFNNLFADVRLLSARSSSELAALAEQAGFPVVRGALAALIQIAPDDHKAVEAALGDLLSALVLAPADPDESELSLRHLRAWLVEQATGRLVVLPLHALRLKGCCEVDQRLLDEHVRQWRARPLHEAIKAPAWLEPAIRSLTTYQFIAPDLDAARALAAHLPIGGLCVTPDGEVAHATGALSLPAGARSPVIFGAEAALKALDHESIKANLERARQMHQQAQRAFEQARLELEQVVRARETFAHETQQRRSRIQDAQQKIGALEEALAVLASDIESAESHIASLDQDAAAAEVTLSQHLAALADAQQALDAIEASLLDQYQSQGGWMESLSAAQTKLAAALSDLRSAESLYHERQAALTAAQAQQELRAQRLAELKAQLEAAQGALAQLSVRAAEAESSWRDAEAAIVPLERDIASLEEQLRALEAQRHALERALRERELHLNTVNMELAKHDSDLASLRRLALEELEWDAAGEAPCASVEEQAARVLASLPEVEALPEDTEARIAQLRAQIKRLGAINHEAQAEYEALSERYQFLVAQCDDLEKASAALQQVIAELNSVMRDAFRQTFEAVADAFQVTFKSLFGGGQARLSLVNADDLDTCGVEIHAQPPGKRPQSLALLSGGERSLTAVALLFAILQVKPTPLCVLDEVDAALDESNIGRFRAMLEGLSDRTQFIVITHNRGTIEAASTIYGVSMGADGASTVLSLRLDDVK